MGIDAARTLIKAYSSIKIPLEDTTKHCGTLQPSAVKNSVRDSDDYPEEKDPFSKKNDKTISQSIPKNTTSLNPFGDDEDDSETHSSSETHVDLPASTNEAESDMRPNTENINVINPFKKIADEFLEHINDSYLNNKDIEKHFKKLEERSSDFIQPLNNENKFEWIPDKEPKTKKEFDDIIKTINDTSNKSGQLYKIAKIFENRINDKDNISGSTDVLESCNHDKKSEVNQKNKQYLEILNHYINGSSIGNKLTIARFQRNETTRLKKIQQRLSAEIVRIENKKAEWVNPPDTSQEFDDLMTQTLEAFKEGSSLRKNLRKCFPEETNKIIAKIEVKKINSKVEKLSEKNKKILEQKMNKYQNELNNAKNFTDLEKLSIKLNKNQKKLLEEFKKDMKKLNISEDTLNEIENIFNSEIKNKIDELNSEEAIKAIVGNKTDVIYFPKNRFGIKIHAKSMSPDKITEYGVIIKKRVDKITARKIPEKWEKIAIQEVKKIASDKLNEIEKFYLQKTFTRRLLGLMTSIPTVAGSVAGISAAVLLFYTTTVGIVPALIVGGALLLGGLLIGLRKILQNRKVPEAILRVREDLEKI
ncbi:hypothetical protein BJP44_05790 [Candidatus Williamhamiltonella defendens]|uniref:Uncharacterized protein n=1 Tax=Hamiltonella defensa subsp. Acyrthosiphon pisum (strain 5AT) TaxID=572265 RepID=C4K5W0_HAMD5|nr:hypothetical protein [Candidatus Hamiltonella defensa]ACQ67953.1 hypothetical protein HDEF_1302 [Candidatus Hamiltonella defensa 5AT (Acyrthosiphon pisum)]ATW22591.1 hypothetical protein BJP44_05790 [Candidatus Hamiltonella defensa]